MKGWHTGAMGQALNEALSILEQQVRSEAMGRLIETSECDYVVAEDGRAIQSRAGDARARKEEQTQDTLERGTTWGQKLSRP